MSIRFEILTLPNMRKLTPGVKLQEHGIVFERFSNGDGRFSVNIRVDKLRVHRVIGWESAGVTRTQAEAFIEQAKTDARMGRLKLPRGRKVPMTFKDAAIQYLQRQAQIGAKNLRCKQIYIPLRLIPFYGDRALSELSSFDLERYKKQRLEEGAAPASINRELAVLSHLLNSAVEWGWIERNPYAGRLKRLKEPPPPATYLTVEQIERLLNAAAQDTDSPIHLFIKIGLDTGMRLTEILSIQIPNIDPKRQRIYIPKAKDEPRQQPITQRLAEYFNQYLPSLPPEQKWLFPNRTKGKDHHRTHIEKAFRRVVKRAGLNPDEVKRHTLRHTFATHVVQSGIDLPTAMRLTGHKTPQMIHRYSHQSGEHIRAAMDLLEQRYSTQKVTRDTQMTHATKKPSLRKASN